MYFKKETRAAKPQIEPNYANYHIPYDYFVVVDAGSHGSRVFIYSWLNPLIGLERKIDFGKYTKYELEGEGSESSGNSGNSETPKGSTSAENEDSDEESDNSEDEDEKKGKTKTDSKNKNSKRGISKYSSEKNHISLPQIFNLKHWHYKEHTGLATLHENPKGIEKHIKGLLRLASEVVPKSQHYRTPIFVHSTAGMRLIPEDRQKVVLDEVCKILTNQSDFFIPDCSSHVNIIDGETEGLYGWLALNYLKGLFSTLETPAEPSTYGFLDMGGMSTQVVFQPNEKEVEKHPNEVYTVDLFPLPETTTNDDNSIEYKVAESTKYAVSTRSFLGLGESEAHRKYLTHLAQKSSDVDSSAVKDPCSPKDYQHFLEIDGNKVEFKGTGKFEDCEVSIFGVFSEYYLPADDADNNDKENSDCHDIQSEDHISTCLLSSKLPAFDFDHDKFVGVSEYKQAVSDLETLDLLHKKKAKDYNYADFKKATNKICTKDYEKVKDLAEKHDFDLHGLTRLCFQTSWILNVLHVGLGFPNEGSKKTGGPVLQLEENIDGHKFSWTLGRAVLYANDEYTQAYSNFSILAGNGNKKNDNNAVGEGKGEGTDNEKSIQRLGYTTRENIFVNGAESGQFTRPYFQIPSSSAKYTYYDYETAPSHVSGLWVQSALLFALIGMMIWLYRSGLKQVVGFYDGISRVVQQAKGYTSVGGGGGLGLEDEMELNEMEASEMGNDTDADQFVVDSDTDENV